MKQGRAFLEAITGGIMPSKFLFSDYNFMYQPYRNGQPYGDPQPYPLFYVQETMGDCCSKDCWCRCCCSPRNPSLMRFYSAGEPYDPGPCKCCGTVCWENDDASDKLGDPFMTLERYGCCSRFANCCVCCECCQDEMRLHYGKQGDSDNGDTMAGTLAYDHVISRAVVPIGGGGCTPTIEIFQRKVEGGVLQGDTPPGAAKTDAEDRTMVVEGPMCFGGFKDLCCDTEYTISSDNGGSGDIARVTKKKPEGCSEWCRACCSTADTYDLNLSDRGHQMAPEQKAMMIGEMVHLDLMFFENDKFPIECERQGDTTWINILCCVAYCYGCLVPIKCCIPCRDKGD